MPPPVPPPPFILYSFQAPLREAVVVARPSKVVRTPYVADIQFPGEDTIYQAHAPSLGCSGLVDVGSHVYVFGKEPKEGGAKTTHTVFGTSVHGGFRVGVNPMVANRMVKAILETGITEEWRTLGGGVASIQMEVVAGDSRVDMCVTHKDESKTWVEVKNVPLSHYRNDVKGCADYRAAAAQPPPAGVALSEKIALFPDGYRKKKDDAVSPRATKHLENLAALVRGGGRAYCVFLCQRIDAVHFEPAALDAVYTAAFKSAVAAGVEARCYVVAWKEGFTAASFYKEIPVILRD